MRYSFLRFLLVGLINTFIGLSIMYLLLHFAGFSYWLSTFTGNLTGACISYLLNRSFTFQNNQPMRSTCYRFFIIVGLCYFLAYFLGIHSAFWLIQKISSLPLTLAGDMAILIGTAFYTILNYFGQKKFVFSK